MASSILTEAENKVTQIRQNPKEDKKLYADSLEEYVAESSSVHSDNMLVNYYVQGLLPTTRDTVTGTLHRMTIDQRSAISVVIHLAQAEGQTYRAQTALCEEMATALVNRKPVMLIADPLDKLFEDYSTGPPTCLEPELSPFLLRPDTEQTTDVSTLAS